MFRWGNVSSFYFLPTSKHIKIKESKLLLILKQPYLARTNHPERHTKVRQAHAMPLIKLKPKCYFCWFHKYRHGNAVNKRKSLFWCQKWISIHHAHTHILIAIKTNRFNVVVDNIGMHNRWNRAIYLKPKKKPSATTIHSVRHQLP